MKRCPRIDELDEIDELSPNNASNRLLILPDRPDTFEILQSENVMIPVLDGRPNINNAYHVPRLVMGQSYPGQPFTITVMVSSIKCRFVYAAGQGRFAVKNLSESRPIFFDQLLSRADPTMGRCIGMPYYARPGKTVYLEPYSPNEGSRVASSAWNVRTEIDTGEQKYQSLFQLRLLFPHQPVSLPYSSRRADGLSKLKRPLRAGRRRNWEQYPQVTLEKADTWPRHGMIAFRTSTAIRPSSFEREANFRDASHAQSRALCTEP